MRYGIPQIPERPPRDRRRDCWNLVRQLLYTIREIPPGDRGVLEDLALLLEKYRP